MQDIYNFDETGFRIGCGRGYTVVTLHKKKQIRLIDAENRDYITSVECVSADGWVIPLMLILAGVNILEKWALKNRIPGATLLGVSPTGYTNDELSMEWIRYFDIHTAGRRRGAWRLLLMDGCGAYITWEFIDYCNTNKIKLVLLPVHATHFLQPLDVGIFQPFKHWHAEGVNKAMRLGAEDFNKLDFLDLFPRIYTETFRSSTIQGAWRATGLVPDTGLDLVNTADFSLVSFQPYEHAYYAHPSHRTRNNLTPHTTIIHTRIYPVS